MEDTDLHRAENMDESVLGEQLDVCFAPASQSVTLSQTVAHQDSVHTPDRPKSFAASHKCAQQISQ